MMCDYWDTQLPESVSFDTVMQSAEDLRKDYDDMKAQRDALLAACEAAYPLLIQNRNHLEAIELAEVGNCPACADYEGFGELCSNHRQQAELTAAITMIEAAIAHARNEDEDEDPSLTDDFGAFEVIDGVDYSDID